MLALAMAAIATAVAATTAYLAWPKGGAVAEGDVPVAISRSWSTFSVNGSTADEIKRSLSYYGPAGHWGIARYHIAWPADFVPRGGACRPERGRIEVKVRIRTPVLSAFARTPRCLRESFERMTSALLEHEEGHASITIDGARAMAAGLREVGARPTCEEARSAWDAKARAAMATIASEQSRFDRLTSHGTATGVDVHDCGAQ